MTCRWVACTLPAHPYFCDEHARRVATATTTLDAERPEDQ